MPIIPPGDIERMVEAVRHGWASSCDGPDLAAVFSPPALADAAAVIDVLIADCEERAERGQPDGFDLYARIVPGFATRLEVVRALLMQLIAARQGADRAAQIESLRERFPPLAEEIAVVADLCDELADSFSIPADTSPEPVAGQSLGKYRLVERLGRGSFGEVWQALDSELDRYVALKILYQDAARGEQATLERALAEARAAAALAHEYIVTVHAVGRLAELSRFFIDSALVGDADPTRDDPKRMSLGRSLEAWALRDGSAALAPREAARLMAQVCRGIAAAHARGVLHRDIKPANILVTPSGKPRVADFGLSTTGLPVMPQDGEPSLHSVSLRSESGRRIVGTPAYMSPEQAAGDRPTPLSDVYSLGATLRFVLTGSPPFKPSGRFSTDARWDVIAQVREASEPIALSDPRIPGVLAAVCGRAMARKPEGRYTSAAEFADDLEAWLAHRPTRAMPPSAAGSSALWFRRNSAFGALGVAAVAALAAGAAIYIVNVGQERDRAVAAERLAQRHLAESEAARVTALATSEFLDGILSSPDPRMEGKDVTVLAALRRSSGLIEQRLKGQETVEAAVRTSIGHAYAALEDIKAARPHLDRALEIRTRLLGADHPDTLKTRHELALVTALESRVDDAIVMMKEVVATSRRVLGDDHPDTMEAIHDLAATLAWSKHKEDLPLALEAYKEATERRERVFGKDDRRALDSKQGYAGVLYTSGKPAEAEPIIREVVETRRRVNESTDVERLNAINDLATIIRALNKEEEALPLLQEAYAGLRAQMPKGHIDLISSGLNVTGLLNKLGRGEEALPIAIELRAAADETLGEENTFRWMTHIAYGDTMTALGRFEEAERELLPAYEAIVKVIGPETRTARTAATRIVRLYDKWGKPEEVEKWKPRTVRSDAPPAAPAAPK